MRDLVWKLRLDPRSHFRGNIPASAHEHSGSHRSGNGSNPYARLPNGRRHEHNRALDGHRVNVTLEKIDSRLSRQCRYHHTILVQKWLATPGCRIKLDFIP